MPDYIVYDLWKLVETSLYALLAYFIVKISHGTIRELLSGIASELRSFAKLDPSVRTLNMLFGILILVFILAILAAVEVAEVRNREMAVPSAIMMLAGIFFLVLFYSLSVVYCRKVENKDS
jgi:hypothetical protein